MDNDILYGYLIARALSRVKDLDLIDIELTIAFYSIERPIFDDDDNELGLPGMNKDNVLGGDMIENL